MNVSKKSLRDHFEILKELIPEVYTEDSSQSQDSDSQQLFELLKRSLSIIEATYIQEKDSFHSARIEEYGMIIKDLRSLGYQYEGQEALINKATSELIMKAKKPMMKAKGVKKNSNNRKAM